MPRRAENDSHADSGAGTAASVAAHLAALDAAIGTSGRATRRKEQGSHYTPDALVAWVVSSVSPWSFDRARDGEQPPVRTLDPACGAGNFLVAVAERLIARGVPAAEVLSERIFGIDIDEAAVGLCRARLMALLPADASAGVRARAAQALAAHVLVGDALERGIAEITGVDRFECIVGNPPFLNQLEVATTASRARAARIRERSGGVVRGYADLAAAFLLEALRHAAPQGVVGFVMPQSFLAAADARAARAWIAARARLRSIWTADERLFEDASVRVSALVATNEPGLDAGPLHGWEFARAFGAGFAPMAAAGSADLAGEAPWSTLFADARGVPRFEVADAPSLGAVALATADFRDQFYGLRGAIVDRAEADGARFPPLVSTRHIELARCRWGEVPARILFERHAAPRADRDTLERDEQMAAWMRARLVPKVLVATQTKVLEAVVDEQGAWLPVVPVLTVTPRADTGIDLWMLAAAIASPAATAHAARISYGTALAASAIKLSARQLLALPIPCDRAAWEESARFFREASGARESAVRARALRAFAASACRAHALDAAHAREVLAFWLARAALDD